MLDVGGRVIFLTGAPLPSSLGWTEEELCAPLQPGFLEKGAVESTGRSTSDGKAPSWRILPLKKPHLPTGLSQISREDLPLEDYDYINDETSFLSTTELSFISADPNQFSSQGSQISDSEKENLFTQYYEQSLAVHENIPSSQIVGVESFDESFATESEDFSIALSASSQSPAEAQLSRSRLTSSHLSDLKEMPNAAYLHSITPQTMTVNLVVGIISISQPRTIRTRKGGRLVELVEMLVGDDTKAGFGINIWLPPSQESNHSALQGSDLRTQTLQLRPQDVVLAKTVALSSFRGKVYGQSLRRGMTTLDLLYRNVVDGDDTRGAYSADELKEGAINEPQVRKVRDVKDWVMRFVGVNTGALPSGKVSKARPAGEKRLQALPEDTPQK
ncbi:MAG: hypothetical protein ALECFALPRED_007773 [Alectoria fallacina]|uniref:Uncharacterized protein n=1 Tax=Alectoria fallacina TaxID=1903189 RepID=A0A8H3ETG7_9LECA|nr:MAG: hypothetical protein ALECFALPRED_007773 [Alectoria fallacina]